MTRILKRRGGFGRVSLDAARVGDIVSLAGVGGASVTDTLGSPLVTSPLPAVGVDPPTLSMVFSVNDSPLAGREGIHLTGSKIGARLFSEAESNVSIHVAADAGGGEAFEVQGRGELALGVLVETMRREGFELSVSPPEVLLRSAPGGGTLEPWEEVTLEVDENHVGPVIDALSTRGAEVRDMQPGAGEARKSRILLRCPARGLLGFRSEFASLTRGGGVMQRSFEGYAPLKSGLDPGRKGVLVSCGEGSATSFALNLLEERGALFVAPGTAVYNGMIIGENARDGDMEVNPTKEKKLTNMRNTGTEETVRLTPPRRFGVEEAIGYVRAGELVESAAAARTAFCSLANPFGVQSRPTTSACANAPLTRRFAKLRSEKHERMRGLSQFFSSTRCLHTTGYMRELLRGMAAHSCKFRKARTFINTQFCDQNVLAPAPPKSPNFLVKKPLHARRRVARYFVSSFIACASGSV